MKITNIAINDLNPAIYNPRLDLQPDDKEYQDIKRSIVEFTLVEPLVVNKDMTVIGGHQRLKVLKNLQYKEVPCIVVDLDKQKEKMLNIALNKISGDWDRIKLKDILEELDSGEYDITLTGWGEQEMEDLMTEFHVDPEEDDFDADGAVEKIKEPICKRGDIWQLGDHRLMCGDATVEEDVKKLMDGKKADMVFTDPPYNVNYSSKNELLNLYGKGNNVQDEIIIDNFIDKDEYIKWIKKWFDILIKQLTDYNSIYVCGNYETLISFYDFEELKISNVLVWVKNSLVLGRMDYKCQHENILYGWVKHHKWYGPNNETTTWNINKPLSSKLHPTMKPIELCSRGINNSSKVNNIILDLFGGSGSTLIACEQLNRKCYMAEIDPIYIQVILERYIKYKGTSDDVFLLKDGEKIPYKEIFV